MMGLPPFPLFTADGCVISVSKRRPDFEGLLGLGLDADATEESGGLVDKGL